MQIAVINAQAPQHAIERLAVTAELFIRRDKQRRQNAVCNAAWKRSANALRRASLIT